MILGTALTKFVWWYCLFTLFFYRGLMEAIPWQIDLDGARRNFSAFKINNTQQIEQNADGGEKLIKSALSEQLMNVAAAAGQPMPRFPWQPEPIHFQNSLTKTDGSANDLQPVVQRSVRDSDNAVKVAAKQTELQQLLQQLYQAEATVQMEVGEVTRSQQIATEAEQMLEEATNKVRMLSSDLQAAQENAATCAMRAHTAQLQLAAHDQLMFTARQRVDALSAQMVSVQAELASVQNSFTLNESSQHLEQQGRLNNIYQFQSGYMGNNSPDQSVAAVAAAAAAPPGSLLIVPPGPGDQQPNSYPIYRAPEQQATPQKKK